VHPPEDLETLRPSLALLRCELSKSGNRCTPIFILNLYLEFVAIRKIDWQGSLRFRNPGSFGRRETHASHGRFTPAAKLQSRATIGSRVSAGLALDGGESEGNPVAAAQ
jgi:hypothetical protein